MKDWDSNSLGKSIVNKEELNIIVIPFDSVRDIDKSAKGRRLRI